jgi:hypothetical protein
VLVCAHARGEGALLAVKWFFVVCGKD